MKMYVAGQWIDKPQTINVMNPYDNSVIDTVPRADRSDVERALGSAVRGAQVMAKLPGYERWKILKKAADIIPFNFPLNLVCHKVGPALAAGNAVVLKPATDTPLSALKLTEILLQAGLPPEGVQCVTGSGGEIGDLICADRRVRKITFTGSREVGEHICRTAGIQKVTMELGSN